MTKASDFRAMTNDQLEDQLKQLHTEWRDLRFQEAVGNLTNTARTRQIRKDIARILTVQSEPERQPVAVS
ncbi:MAG: 50S ribosomal protein L29 [Thermomicrobiales bacterium]